MYLAMYTVGHDTQYHLHTKLHMVAHGVRGLVYIAIAGGVVHISVHRLYSYTSMFAEPARASSPRLLAARSEGASMASRTRRSPLE